MNQNVKGGFSQQNTNTPETGKQTANSKVGSKSVVITRPDGSGEFEFVEVISTTYG